jgi:hypothetical protein
LFGKERIDLRSFYDYNTRLWGNLGIKRIGNIFSMSVYGLIGLEVKDSDSGFFFLREGRAYQRKKE